MSGAKILSAENWQKPDPVTASFVSVDWGTGVATAMDGNAFASAFLDVELDCAPAGLREMFDVARGAMVYGWFYYPLYALGIEQLFRVAEHAVSLRYEAEGGRKRISCQAGPPPNQRTRRRVARYEDKIEHGLRKRPSCRRRS